VPAPPRLEIAVYDNDVGTETREPDGVGATHTAARAGDYGVPSDQGLWCAHFLLETSVDRSSVNLKNLAN
jgi:hypothetical protein